VLDVLGVRLVVVLFLSSGLQIGWIPDTPAVTGKGSRCFDSPLALLFPVPVPVMGRVLVELRRELAGRALSVGLAMVAIGPTCIGGDLVLAVGCVR
jgi:hypothetical protein